MSSPKTENKKVFVAMSGGVDSSVAAALLKKRGYDVTGVFMRPWSPNHETWNMKHGTCIWQKDREDAMRVAAKIGTPLLTWDFSKEYKKEVTDYMIREYKAGRTPNPDVMCNKHIKFGLFLEKALKEGADFIATGHHVRIKQKGVARLGDPRRDFSLHIARDKNKDQSYFLWTLTQKQLKYCLFPIGDYTKPEVRKMAKKFGLPTHDKKDSQGVCFIGPLDMKEFLKNYIKPKKGKILSVAGREVGTHDGIFYYTIGQRHGLDIKDGQGPYYVVKKDIVANTLVVAKGNNYHALYGKETKLADVNFITQQHSHILENMRMSGIKISTRVRYRQPLVRAKIAFTNGSKKSQRISACKPVLARMFFEKPQKAITPGQSAVFYKGRELLGGGIIV